MPKVSAQHLAAREEQILQAAWRCFSRNGFHATSMQDVIAEAGLSAGAVYRYFKSKDDLIVASAGHALDVARSLFAELLAGDATPAPAEAIAQVTAAVSKFADQDGNDLARLAVQAWAEALRNPRLKEAAAGAYGELRGQFTEVARRWQRAGHLAPDADPALVGQALFSLVPGFILQRLILEDVDPEGYAAGVRALFDQR